ncbi:hypothetical protein M422DRAFT_204264, partial [Sphaerobolus stellatus SS14]
MSSFTNQPRQGYVWLVLFKRVPENFYLEVPIEVISQNCLKPLKYLRYLGWCILAREGTLKDAWGQAVDLNGTLSSDGKYFYDLEDDTNILEYAVDLEVIKQRSSVPSESSATRTGFRDLLSVRDPRCVFTYGGLAGCTAAHIIPYRRGDEWVKLIIDNRPHGEESFDDWKGINDERNGLVMANNIYSFFDRRAVLVLKTPNPILTTQDVSPRYERPAVANIRYPSFSRYTLQWVSFLEPENFLFIPNNNDATFSTMSTLAKPSDLLLHYNYGVAALKHWGKNIDALLSNAKFPRPQIPQATLMGAPKKTFDRDTFQTKLNQSREGGNNSTGGGAAASGGPTDSQHNGWDEDDIMLFLWGNTQAAMERHEAEKNKRNKFIQDWGSSISSS